MPELEERTPVGRMARPSQSPPLVCEVPAGWLGVISRFRPNRLKKLSILFYLSNNKQKLLQGLLYLQLGTGLPCERPLHEISLRGRYLALRADGFPAECVIIAAVHLKNKCVFSTNALKHGFKGGSISYQMTSSHPQSF